MCIDWEQLDTGNCRQNADLQKVERAVVKSARSGQYGSVGAAPPAVQPGLCLTSHTPGHKAALSRVERRETDGTTLLPEHKQMFSKHTHTHSAAAQPLPVIVCYRGKAFTKRGQGQDSPW